MVQRSPLLSARPRLRFKSRMVAAIPKSLQLNEGVDILLGVPAGMARAHCGSVAHAFVREPGTRGTYGLYIRFPDGAARVGKGEPRSSAPPTPPHVRVRTDYLTFAGWVCLWTGCLLGTCSTKP